MFLPGLCVSLLCTFCFLLPQLDLLEAEAIADVVVSHSTPELTHTHSSTQTHTPGPCASLLRSLRFVLLQLDLLEAEAIADVVVLSVVLEEVKHKNVSAYNRLRALCANKERRFFVFANEHHRYAPPLLTHLSGHGRPSALKPIGKNGPLPMAHCP